jgi:hypothetical protein
MTSCRRAGAENKELGDPVLSTRVRDLGVLLTWLSGERDWVGLGVLSVTREWNH